MLRRSPVQAVLLIAASLTSGGARAEVHTQVAAEDSDHAIGDGGAGEVEQEPSEGGDGPQLLDRGSLTAQWFWANDKIMPGLEFSVGYKWVQIDAEFSFLTLSERSEEIGGSFLGNQLGVFLMLTPLRERYYDVSAGLGGDFYFLWGIHSEVVESALAPRLGLRVWPLEHFGISLTARVYLVSSEGLELGTEPDGGDGLPLLISTGLSWSFR